MKYRISADIGVTENLNDLPFLNEPEILNCLKRRYWQDQIYTYTGSILIALNPFKQITGLYTDELLTTFCDPTAQRIPHIWDIASQVYHRILDELDTGSDQDAPDIPSYSILISGESGSGKSESCKYLLKHLTKAGSLDFLSSPLSHTSSTKKASIMDQIMDSNPILEAFGNSRTTRNSNSSRFGKYITLRFNDDGSIIGGSIQTYLLENVRVVNQQSGERNFHIFSYLIGGATEAEKKRWHVDQHEFFHYMGHGHSAELNVVSDTAKLMNLKESFAKLNFDMDTIELLFDIAAGILHIGQIKFDSINDTSGEIARVINPLPLQRASKLCGFAAYELEEALTVRTVQSRGENFKKSLSKSQAINARDAIAKTVYKRVFDWLVAAINDNISSRSNIVAATIGILDIFGFECFDHNSFEQLCINYANEALQKQFNSYVFEQELIEYSKEGIKFNVSFNNNQESLDLIGIHIFKILDDQCKLPNSSDERFASQLYKDLSKKAKFSASIKEQRDLQFTIHHFAGPVQYSTDRFVEKNVDELPSDIAMMLQHSLNSILSSCLEEPKPAIINTPARKTAVKPSLSLQFKSQLNELMVKLGATAPYFVRCIKPRDIESNDRSQGRNNSNTGYRLNNSNY